MTEQLGYFPIFSLATVLIGWITGIIWGVLFMELGLRKSGWSFIFAVPLTALFFYLIFRDEKAAK